MTDYFALLDEPRRPWLDVETLKQKFLTRASATHPDRFHAAAESEKAAVTERYARLNAAFQCLAEPKSRLLHLLELELGAKPDDIQSIPNALGTLFAEVVNLCREVDAFLAARAQVTSPLLRVRQFELSQAWIERLNGLRAKLDGPGGQLLGELKSLDEQWLVSTPIQRRELLPNLEELYRLFSYFNRWNQQLSERIAQLSF